MTEAAAARGAANDVSAVTGPPLPPHLELAVALREATAADEGVARMEAKVAKAKTAAADMTATAAEGLRQAKAAQKAADARVTRLTGDDGGADALAGLKATAAEALAAYEAAAARLGENGG